MGGDRNVFQVVRSWNIHSPIWREMLSESSSSVGNTAFTPKDILDPSPRKRFNVFNVERKQPNMYQEGRPTYQGYYGNVCALQ